MGIEPDTVAAAVRRVPESRLAVRTSCDRRQRRTKPCEPLARKRRCGALHLLATAAPAVRSRADDLRSLAAGAEAAPEPWRPRRPAAAGSADRSDSGAVGLSQQRALHEVLLRSLRGGPAGLPPQYPRCPLAATAGCRADATLAGERPFVDQTRHTPGRLAHRPPPRSRFAVISSSPRHDRRASP